MSFEPTEEILAVARSLPQGLCDHCLGRRFARVQQATNSERGRAIRLALAAAGARSEPAEFCPICDNIFDELDGIARAAARKMAPYEFSTFLVGSKQEASTLELEERLGYPEHLKQEVNRELGKRLETLTGKTVDFESPDVTIIVDIAFGSVEIQLAPLFIYGRYRKLERGIPQTRWPCRACRGKGCARCGGTGRMYQTSVEELIAGPVMKAAGGSSHALHGMGREDIDARMLGGGRPFVLEVREPMRRALDLVALQEEINRLAAGRVEVSGLRPSSMEEVRGLKESRVPKCYLATVEFSSPVPEEKLKLLERTFTGLEVQQRTPLRVSHRRADLTRVRRVLEFRVEGPDRFRITAEAGLYIKELISGDGGRTRPSVSEALGVGCLVRELDVLSTGGSGDGEGVEGLQGEDEEDPEG
ncbi:MAG: tRNA pseudouridine(54/55) synthase Pus10 [Thermoplasmata archaeon]